MRANPGQARRRLKAAIGLIGGILLVASLGWLAWRRVPIPSSLFASSPSQLELFDCQGEPLRMVRAPGQPFGRSVAGGDIPLALVDATIAVEDQRFWNHPGVDWRGSLRALRDLVRYRRVVSGGSTITQQLIKLAQPRRRTWRAKVLETLQAMRLEQIWGKQRILTEYLNRLDYGNFNRGCAAAAEFYFAKPLPDLSVAECALLAGLPQAPSRLNPLKHPDRAAQRQKHVLTRMLACQALSQLEFDQARRETLKLVRAGRSFHAPHFVDLLLTEPDLWLPEFRTEPVTAAAIASGPIRTTVDLSLNEAVSRSIRQQLDRLDARKVRNAAAVVIENRTGAVRALVGSGSYFSMQAGQVNGAWAPRSAGSTLKPFTYLLAFEQGATPATVVADVATDFTTATGLFSPVNYDQRCHGPVRYRVALANSLNIAAVKVLASIGGPAPLQARLQASGLTTLTNEPEHYGLGLTIGNAEVRLLELANAFATLARLGEFRPYRLVEQVGEEWVAIRPAHPVFDPAASFLIADILSDNAARTLAFGAESSLRFEFPVACKTGTSSDFRDNWAFGYTPEFTVGVWAGNFDGTPMQSVSGVTGAAPILHTVMTYLHQRRGTSWFPTPSAIVSLPINPITGKRPAGLLSKGRIEPCLEKFDPRHLPPEEVEADYDRLGRIRLPTEYAAWFETSDNWLKENAVVAERTSHLRIAFPLPGTRLFLDPDLPNDGQRLFLQVQGSARADWASPSLRCGREGDRALAWLEPGTHRLSARDEATGTTAETWIEVSPR